VPQSYVSGFMTGGSMNEGWIKVGDRVFAAALQGEDGGQFRLSVERMPGGTGPFGAPGSDLDMGPRHHGTPPWRLPRRLPSSGGRAVLP
jgi:hypothetical protein